MRCPKCGKINFDYLERCPNCGQDFREISRRLGGFIRPGPGLNWFTMEFQSVEDPETDLKDPGLIETLNTVARDRDFQEAVDQLLRD